MEKPNDAPESLRGPQRARYVHNLFARVAPHYDLVNGLITGGLHRLWRRATIRRAREHLRPDGSTRPFRGLDLCCGTGDYAFLLREVFGEEARVVGVDFCEPMMRGAVERAGRPAGGGWTAWIKADVTDLATLRDGSFDMATVGFGLRNVVDLPAALREAARVLRSGGLFVTLELTRPEGGPLRPLILAYLRWVLPALARMGRGDRDDYLWLRRSLEAFPSASGLSRMMEQAGFEVVGVMRFGLGAVAGHIARRRGEARESARGVP